MENINLAPAPAVVLLSREALRYFGPLSPREISSKLALRGYVLLPGPIADALETENRLPVHQRCVREASLIVRPTDRLQVLYRAC